MWHQFKISASYFSAPVQACMLALLMLLSHEPARAQSVPMPDLGVYMQACNQIEGPCAIGPVIYLNKAPGDNYCYGYVCSSGPGRYQQIGRAGYPAGSYIYTYVFVPDDVIITMAGASHTKALPAGPVLPQTIKLTQGGQAYPRGSIGLRMNGGGVQWGVSNAAGEWTVNYVPPSRRTETVQLSAFCPGCINAVEKTINVAACDISRCASGQSLATVVHHRGDCF